LLLGILQRIMLTKLTFHEIHSLGGVTLGDHVTTPLPFEVLPGVTIADMSSWVTDQTLAWVSKQLGIYQTEILKNIRYALVHTYETSETLRGTPQDVDSEKLVQNLVELIHIIRPMRQRTSIVRAEQSEEGRSVVHLDSPDVLEVPEVQKLYHFRDQDLQLLKKLAQPFLFAMQSNASKFKTSVFYHSVGRKLSQGNAKFLLWCSAIEALYTSHNLEHQGKLVATERVKHFLGAKTLIYEKDDFPCSWFQSPSKVTIEDIVQDLYAVRNYIAHGDVIPRKYFSAMRSGLGGDVSTIEVLSEGVSFIIRKSLLRIVTEGLLSHFENAKSSDAYFGALGLTKRVLRTTTKT
jgi:hypothetical protein